MDCPECGKASRVLDSRKVEAKVYRRRVCKVCDFSFTTYETYDKSASRPTLPNAKRKKMNIVTTKQAMAVVSRITMPEPPPPTLKVTRVETPRQPGLTVPGSTATHMSEAQLDRSRRLRDLLNRQVEEDDE